MRIESVHMPERGVSQVQPEAVPLEVSPGDVLTARVLASENGAARLRTPDGAVFTARLEGGLTPRAGETVELIVTELRDGVIYMSPLTMASSRAPRGPQLGDIPADGVMARFISQLEAMNLPVTRETLLIMGEALAANPGMPLREAAFLAANGFELNAETLEAAARFLDGGGRTAALESLAETAAQHAGETARSAPEQAAQTPQTVPEQAARSAQSAPGQTQQTMPEQTPQTPQIVSEQVLRTTQTVSAQATQAAPEQSARPMDAVLPQPAQSAETAVTAAAQGMAAPPADLAESAPLTAFLRAFLPDIPGSSNPGNSNSGNVIVAPQADAGAAVIEAQNAADGGVVARPVEGMRPAPEAVSVNTLAAALSETPELAKHMPPRRIADFAGSLLRSAADAEPLGAGNANPAVPDPGKLDEFIKKLFPEINREQNGAALKAARDELPIKLALLEEALSRSAAESNNALLGQVRQIRQDERMWNNIEHYVYTQVPVKTDDERRTAELYIFKRRREQKKLDAENVNILLAVDLPRLGHTESFIGIRGRGVSVHMSVDTESARAFFTESAPALHALLGGAGFRLDNIKVSCDDKDNADPLNAMLVPGMFVKPSRLDLVM